jgi:hypothetical protein
MKRRKQKREKCDRKRKKKKGKIRINGIMSKRVK